MENVAQTSGKGSHNRRRSRTHIDMTPMVDLAFLLLTFFVLTTSLNESYILPITIPEQNVPDPPPVSASRVLTLLLGENDNIYWYQGYPNHPLSKTVFASQGVRKLLKQKDKEIARMIVLIKASDKSRYKNVVDIVDEMLITGIDQYAMVDITPEEKILINKYR
jgi:biopolymer transport protein ExbD